MDYRLTATGIATSGARPQVRRIGLSDVRAALSLGVQDFLAMPTQLLFLGILYPLVGVVAAQAAFERELLPLLYPLVAGLSLLGPIAAVGIYELSRRRERGEQPRWSDAASVVRSPSISSILAIGVLLLAIFVAWLQAAMSIYGNTVGALPLEEPQGPVALVGEVFTTAAGWELLLYGNLAGFLFAAAVLSLTVVSIPLLLDRPVGAMVAIQTSLRAVARNPVPMAAWGLVVAGLLFLGSLPLFVGLAVVMPILGHATWHLYRRVVA